jgi:phage terminase large subunit-like protein
MGKYSKEKANDVIDVVMGLRHTKDPWAGQLFNLKPWQEVWLRDIFGTLNSDLTRQYRTAYIEIPRKNGKSELAAAIVMYLLFWEGERGGEIYSAGADVKQASIVFDIVVAMIRQDSFYLDKCRIYESTKLIKVPELNAKYQALSAEHATKHGFNASAIIFDELHAQPNRELWDVLQTSGGTRRQPLTVAITTAGFDRLSICWELHSYAKQIKESILEDKTFYPVIYSAPEDADWTDENVWRECNPALEDFRDINEMREKCEKAKNLPAFENTFRRLYLNQWTTQETRFIPMAEWDACDGKVDKEALRGKDFYAGLDLASSIDIAALVLVHGNLEDGYDVIPFFWIPQDGMVERIRRDRVPYDVWEKQGLIKVTSGNQIDYSIIESDISKLQDIYEIREIAFDRAGAVQISQDLTREGFTMIPFGQGFMSMGGPTRELLAHILNHKIHHGNNPVLRWMADNTIVKLDPIIR